MQSYYVEKENKALAEQGLEFFLYQLTPERPYASAHLHPAIELLYFTEGEATVYTDGAERVLSVGDAVLFYSNQLHRLQLHSERAAYYVLKLTPAFILRFANPETAPLYLLTLSLRKDGSMRFWERTQCERIGLDRAICALCAQTDAHDFCAELGTRLYAAQILLLLLRQIGLPITREMPQDSLLAKRIYDTLVYVQSHYAEPICATECAERAFLSYSYFSRSFKRVTGKTFSCYLSTVRTDHAEQLLRTTDRSITEIAVACGFESVAYFSAIYKKRKGTPPSAVRREK